MLPFWMSTLSRAEEPAPPVEPPPPEVSSEGPSAGESPPADPEAAPAPEVPAEDQEVEGQSGDARAAEEAYIQAIAAWKRRSWKAAWVDASRALALDPDLTPARLLTGYAALRLGKKSEGAETLAGLWLETGPSPLPADTREEARLVRARYVAPLQRRQWWFGIGQSVFLESAGDTTLPLLGWAIALQAPVFQGLAVRVEGHGPWLGPQDTFDIRGPRFDALAVGLVPLGGGRWHLDLAAGPSAWVATGEFWPDGSQPYVGARVALGLDTRIGLSFGLRTEVGASAYPEATQDFSFYAEPVDIRFLFTGWMGNVPGEPKKVRGS